MYFDHNAGAPLLDEVRVALAEALAPEGGVLAVGNPSSIHGAGRRVRDAVEWARAEIALLAGVDEGEVVLTSGGTEACQLGVLGLARVIGSGTGTVGFGGTNMEGYSLNAAMALSKRAWVRMAYMSADQIAGPQLRTDVFLFDFTAKF